MGPIYKTQWKTCPEVIPTRACRHLLTNSLYGQEKQKYPHACHSAHVWEMMFQKYKTQREKKRGMRGGMCICPFKSPQARAECWESRPVPFSWPLREGRSGSASMDGDVTSEKMQEGATNTSARPNTHITAGADTLSLPQSDSACAGIRVWHSETTTHFIRGHNGYLLFGAQLILCWGRNMNVYVHLKIVVTHWMWGRNRHLSNVVLGGQGCL